MSLIRNTDVVVYPGKLSGSIRLPSSKSQALRAIIFAALAEGPSTLHQLPQTQDVKSLLCALHCAQISIDRIAADSIVIHGCAGAWPSTHRPLDCGNSGIALRFLTAICATRRHSTILTGDRSLFCQRPMADLIEALKALGADAEALLNPGFAPLQVSGPITGDTTTLEGSDSQPVSALLIASALRYAHTTTINVRYPGEISWVRLTLDWLARLDISFDAQADGSRYLVYAPNQAWGGFEYSVPADASALAFWLVGALITGSALKIQGLNFSDPQPDFKLIECVKAMGAQLRIHPELGELIILPTERLSGINIDINAMIDTLPALAVLACYCSSPSQFSGIASAQDKESNRPACLASELKQLGGDLEFNGERLLVRPSILKPGSVIAHRDHRLAMAFSIAALGAQGPIKVEGVSCVAKTDPAFFERLKSLSPQSLQVPARL